MDTGGSLCLRGTAGSRYPLISIHDAAENAYLDNVLPDHLSELGENQVGNRYRPHFLDRITRHTTMYSSSIVRSCSPTVLIRPGLNICE